MAIFCLSTSIEDLKKRLSQIVVAYNNKNEPVLAKDLKAVGAMTALLKDALAPNLVQTLENNPVFIHGGPFANIAHGCNSVIATKAALKEGIVPGGGVALLNASQKIPAKAVGEEILLKAIQAPFYTVLDNAGITMMDGYEDHEGYGIDVVTGERATMISAGIIDPVLVTKSALKNAVSVVSTIISADCVISNMRHNEGN